MNRQIARPHFAVFLLIVQACTVSPPTGNAVADDPKRPLDCKLIATSGAVDRNEEVAGLKRGRVICAEDGLGFVHGPYVAADFKSAVGAPNYPLSKSAAEPPPLMERGARRVQGLPPDLEREPGAVAALAARAADPGGIAWGVVPIVVVPAAA